ncbi:restriction endonuclease subunit S [Cognatishimia activa]|uniref:EcoKI restriction-modification system protein HsdS n=1 Tax=Cognatishimia activa TaxID=1715691 RepID=A0A0P1IL26_9RHOB|nr:restriction endonuclease subunit S [Cognatishimia activa]CUI27686.1 EcoKI restriction-modification system protein HsdS [Cognatishimia activa]CUK24249.1 EcoKI restriction-modification system protein HsdS [Cognatishimia activa]
MSADWPVRSLSEIVDFQTGRLDSNAAEEHGKYPFFTCSPTTLAINTFAFDDEAVLLAGNNANGVFPIKYYQGKFNAYQRTYVLTPKDKTKVSVRWLYFRIKHVTSELQQMSVGTATKFLTKKILDAYEVQLPSFQEQEKCAHILWSLQDKIELNRQTNQTLEEMAQAVFKSWFVDFEPTRAKIKARENGQDPTRAAMAAIAGKTVDQLDTLSPEQINSLTTTADLFPDTLVAAELGEIPEGWQLSEIGNEVSIAGGGTPSTKNEEFWEGGHIHWTSPKDMSNLTDKILLETARKITQAGLDKISSGLLPADTVLMSSRAPVGYLAISKIPVAINQGYIAMTCEGALSPEFVVQWAESIMDDIKQRASGTTFAEISKKNFKIIPVIVPDADLISEYTQVVRYFYNQITENLRETKTLSEIRDTLLPRLLSGEITLSEAV